MSKAAAPNILILAHIVEDAAIQRRASMLRAGGASVVIAGFHRAKVAPASIEGQAVIDLGRTYNAKFFNRIVSIIRGLFRLQSHKDLFDWADIIVARNMEMLACARRGQMLAKRAPPVLVYEVLDIHRLLLRPGLVGKILRYVEGVLAANAALVLTSSPAFIEHYFKGMSRIHAPIHLVENRVIGWLQDNPPQKAQTEIKDGPPWIIGWFGILRCRRSLQLLQELVLKSEGKIEVILRGRPALDQMDDFHAIVSQTPGLSFMGAYKNPDDLPQIYSEIHFIWAIDQFEKGMNSAWLLPNRAYEGCAYAVPPIAESAVETGKFLRRHGIGLTIKFLDVHELLSFFSNLSPDQYRRMKNEMTSIPEKVWRADVGDCVELVNVLSALIKNEKN